MPAVSQLLPRRRKAAESRVQPASSTWARNRTRSFCRPGTQVVDEARHAEVLSRYLLDKCGRQNLSDSPAISKRSSTIFSAMAKWFIKTVGLQLLAETFAVSLFRMLMEIGERSFAARNLQAHPGRRIAAHGIFDPEPARRDSRTQRRRPARARRFHARGAGARDDRAIPARSLRIDGHERGRHPGRAKGAQGNRARQRIRAVPQTVPSRDASDGRQQHAEGRACSTSRTSAFMREMGINTTLADAA